MMNKQSGERKRQNILDELLEFRDLRGWKKFHTPENLAKAISIEAAEILDEFAWGDDWKKPNVVSIATEIADVQIYLIYLANALGISINHAVRLKIAENERKYPL